MKRFIKSTIAVIVALTLLATLSVVGFSASAKDIAVLTVVTEKDDKKVEDMFITKDGSQAEETFNVVDSKTLGNAVDGLPAKAYSATFKAGCGKDGFIIKTESPDIPAEMLAVDEQTWVFEAWIYVEDMNKVGGIVPRLYTTDGMISSGGSYVETYFWQAASFKSDAALQNGWTHVSFVMKNNNGWQPNNPAYATYQTEKKVCGISFVDHSGAKEDYTFAVAGVSLKLVEAESSVVSKIGIPAASSKEAVSSEDVSSAETVTSSETVTSAEISSVADVTDGADEGGVPAWVWIVVGVVAVAVVAGVVVVVLKKGAKK
ncbi:MAG: hypothetical protein IJY56_01250 [Clostridia bacterium]|nr:hypothetical protein [Clostridia bacterium]